MNTKVRTRACFVAVVATSAILCCVYGTEDSHRLLAQESTIPKGPPEDPSLNAHDFSGIWRAVQVRTKRAFRIDDPPLLPTTDALVRSYEALGRAGRIVASARTTCRAGAVNATLIPFDTVIILQNDEAMTLLF